MNIRIPDYLMPDREYITNTIKRVIRDIFINTADEDYVVARTLAFSRNYRAFYWPALQCLEKYLKASLLYQGMPVKRYRHDIVTMASELGTKVTTLSSLKLKPLPMHEPLTENIDWGSTEVSTFIEHIHLNGIASNRYNYFGVSSEYSAVLKLDQVVHALRTALIGNVPFHGLNQGHPLLRFAYDQNPLNAPVGWEHETIWGKFGEAITVPYLEVALNGMFGNERFYEEWLRENISITPQEIDRLKAPPAPREDRDGLYE